MMRGVIRNVERKQQINDFSGLLYGRITPTDIDGLIEYRNKAYVLIEVKYSNADLPTGQKIAIERIVNDTAKAGKKSIAIVAEHNIYDTNEQIDVAKCKVREIYLFNEKQWRNTNRPMNVKEIIDLFIIHIVKERF